MLAANLAVLAAALGVEAALGYPPAMFRRLGHPVTWMGALIGRLERGLNRGTWPSWRRRLAGVLAVLALLAGVALPAWVVQHLALAHLPRTAALAVLGVLAASLPAQRSLWTHVRAVADALHQGLPEARAAVGRIVGRDPASLDAPAVARAAIESLAENFSDGVVAPALWCALLGLPGIAAYKATNTADSMIGHRTQRHEAFGWAAARLDDLVNLPASRLAAAFLIAAAALHPRADAAAALRAVLRDARRHRSPNAGWPEAAMAGALGLRLAGPRTYGGVRVEDAWMGDGTACADAGFIRLALSVYRLACGLQLAVVGLGWAGLAWWG